MYRSTRGGFTLIELLTVIAIIAILAAMLFAGFSRVREMAKLRSVDNAFLQIRNLAAAYYSDNNTYPLPMGGVSQAHKSSYNKIISGALTPGNNYGKYWQTFQTRPYTVALGLHDSQDLTDPFSTFGWNTDLKNTNVSLLEYLPKGTRANPTAPPKFPTDLPPTGAAGNAELARLENLQEQRPYTYIAVNKRHAQISARYWTDNTDPYATNWDWLDTNLRTITLPPPAYDTFVIISQGPGGDTSGLLADTPFQNFGRDVGEVYYLAQLRAFFLATRDWNEDEIPDLSYQGRNARGENYEINNQFGTWNQLPPEALNRNGLGPYIFSYGWK